MTKNHDYAGQYPKVNALCFLGVVAAIENYEGYGTAQTVYKCTIGYFTDSFFKLSTINCFKNHEKQVHV